MSVRPPARYAAELPGLDVSNSRPSRGSALFWAGYAQIYDLIWDSRISEETGRIAVAERPRPALAVDLGCGSGLSSSGLTRHGWRVVGVDSSAVMLERALRTGRVQSTILADASKTGLADCCAELVIAANLLQVCDDPISILDEAWRLLRPGGGLVLFWPSDGATLTTAFAADLHLGRRVPQAALAALGRLAVGLAGVAVGARRRSGGSIASAVDAWATNTGARLTAAGEVARIQTHVTFFKPGHCG